MFRKQQENHFRKYKNFFFALFANNNIYGQDHKDKYFDTSRKLLSQEMTMCNMEALVSYFSEVMTNITFFLNW